MGVTGRQDLAVIDSRILVLAARIVQLCDTYAASPEEALEAVKIADTAICTREEEAK